MRTRIKFCGMVRRSDLDHAVALGVDMVGFVFYRKSPRYLEIEAARELRRGLPSFTGVVGLFVNADPQVLRQTASQVGLDVLQFHGDESSDDCERASRELGLPHWRAVRMRGSSDLIESATFFNTAEALLLDSFSAAYGGTGEAFDWSWLDGLPAPVRGRRLLLAGGLTAERVGPAIVRVAPFGVDVSSGIQADGDPRSKDPGRMERFMQAVVQADAQRAAMRAG